MEHHQTVTEHLSYDQATGLFTVRKTNRVVGTLSMDGYVKVRDPFDKQIKMAHRLAWFYVTSRWPNSQIDHINGVRSDNRFLNLRESTPGENMQNMQRARRDNRVDLIGANFHSPSNRWRSQIKLNGKKIHLGYFDTAYDAHLAYLRAKRDLHPFGEIAKLPEWLLP